MAKFLKPRKPMTGVILSGGKSLRMGIDKAFLKIGGTPIIERTVRLLQGLFEETIVITNQREHYQYLGVNVFNDLIPNLGALGGLYTGISRSSFRYSFVVACDMPFVNRAVIEHLTERTGDYDVIVPKTEDGLQPLHALYSKGCLSAIVEILKEKKNRIIDFFPLVRVNVVEEKGFHSLDPERLSFINLNTHEDLLIFRKKGWTDG
jgi:molybdopterin-guanine dinucleotide biosynthesis protein A